MVEFSSVYTQFGLYLTNTVAAERVCLPADRKRFSPIEHEKFQTTENSFLQINLN